MYGRSATIALGATRRRWTSGGIGGQASTPPPPRPSPTRPGPGPGRVIWGGRGTAASAPGRHHVERGQRSRARPCRSLRTRPAASTGGRIGPARNPTPWEEEARAGPGGGPGRGRDDGPRAASADAPRESTYTAARAARHGRGPGQEPEDAEQERKEHVEGDVALEERVGHAKGWAFRNRIIASQSGRPLPASRKATRNSRAGGAAGERLHLTPARELGQASSAASSTSGRVPATAVPQVRGRGTGRPRARRPRSGAPCVAEDREEDVR